MNAGYATAFVFATITEAEPFLAKLAVNELSRSPCPIYESGGGERPRFLILICGMGLMAAADAVGHLIGKYQPGSIINCGVAGSLSGALGIGEIRQISAVADSSESSDAAAIQFIGAPDHLILPLPGCLGEARLVSQSVPVFDPERRALLATVGDLIDMEGAAVALTCRDRGLPCGLLKVVSDHADNRDTLLRNLVHTSRRLAEFIAYYLQPLLQLDNHHGSTRSRPA